MRRLLLVAMMLMPATALAVRAGDVPEYGRPERTRVVDPAQQAALTASPAWRAFVAKHGNEWRVTWDDRAGTPRSIIGGRIPIETHDVEKSARVFLGTLRDLSGVDDSRLANPSIARRGETIFARFDRVTAGGTPVLGAYAELRIERGAVVLIRLETHPAAEIARTAAIVQRDAIDERAERARSGGEGGRRADRAIDRAEREIAAHLRVPFASRATRVIAPIAAGGGWEYRPAFVVETSDPSRRDRQWKSVVDARHGEVLSRESLVRRAASGTVRADVEPRTIGDPLVTVPLGFATVTIGATNAVTDTAGAFAEPTASTGVAASARLSGPFIVLDSLSSADLRCTFTSGDPADCSLTGLVSDDLAQADAWRSTLVVRSWALGVAPQLPFLQQQLAVNVNIDDECNAYFDGSSINFFADGATCNNTARIADVVYHEFGHWLHQEIRVAGVMDGTIGEGSSDYVSATITNSPSLGPNFFKNGDPVRELEPDLVYPDDLVGQVHADGLIWAGAMWDLRKALIAKHGASGAAVTDAIFAGVLSTGPVLDQVLDEALLADDDDGDLSNGTPNQCEIVDAFSAHGLMSRSEGLTHVEVLGPRLADEATPLFVAMPEPQAALCPLPEVTAARVRYTIDGGATQTIAMSATSGGFTATLPAQAGSHVVRYWFEGDAGPLTFLTPREGQESPFGFWSGPHFVVWEEDFESLPSWEHGGDADDWEIGVPLGLADDPADAFSGANVLGNDLSNDGMYEPFALTWIESPIVDCRGCRNTHLQLRRWLNVEDAIYDQSRIVVNGATVYVNPWNGLGGAMPKDSRWVFQDIDISGVADGERFRVRFSLETDEGLEFGGWTVDDVRIVTPTEPHYDPPSCGCSTTEGTPTFALLPSLLLLLKRRQTSFHD